MPRPPSRRTTRWLALAAVMLALSACAPRALPPAGRRLDCETVFAAARPFLGKPHCLGGDGRHGCYDCSGLVKAVYSRLGLDLPRGSAEQSRIGRPVPLVRRRLRPGDLVFFGRSAARVDHVGIYLEDGRFVHASSSAGVVVANLDDPYWIRRLVTARRPTE